MVTPKRATREQSVAASADVTRRLLEAAPVTAAQRTVVERYLEDRPRAREETEAKLAQVPPRAAGPEGAAAEMPAFRAEILSRAMVHHAVTTAPAAVAEVRDALAEYLGEATRRPQPHKT